MPFITLAERFEQQSKDIYSKFAPSSDQLVVVKPDTSGVFGSKSRIKNDTRAVPVVSTLRDTKRVSKFLTSPEGLLFLGKQTLLQTGNTFAETRVYNPASPLLNTVPFLHTRRHISSQTLTKNPSGLLQRATVQKMAGIVDTPSQPQRGLLARATSAVSSVLLPTPQTYLTSRPEYSAFPYHTTGPVLLPQQPLLERGSIRQKVTINTVSSLLATAGKRTAEFTISTLNRQIPRSLRNSVSLPEEKKTDPTPSFINEAKKFRQTFFDKNNAAAVKYNIESSLVTSAEQGTPSANVIQRNNFSRLNSKYLYETSITDVDKQPDGITRLEKTNLSDNYNKLTNTPTNIASSFGSNGSNQINYFGIKGSERASDTSIYKKSKDIVKFIFSPADPKASRDEDVQFRALITSIKESIQPEFNEQRYAGRTERFVTYAGAKRSLSLEFNIVAFSPEEQYGMWQRVNYLSGLAFPQGISNGFMVPPLFRVTIGGIYENQPCFLQTLDFDFLDETITFDVDNEVPHAVKVTMQVSLLEKRSKFYDSPFYKIVEDMAAEQAALRGNNR